jgi:hypothetical protein
VAGGCGSSSDSSSTAAVVQNELATAPSFLEQQTDAHETVRYRGERHIELYQDGAKVLDYTEEVGSDGEGRFALDILEVFSAQIDPDLFRIAQGPRRSFHQRYRDVGIHDLKRALENYTVRVRDESVWVAGVECVDVEAQLRRGAGSTYRMCIEPQTGLRLSSEERTQTGQLVRRMEFKRIDMDPDLSDLQLSRWRMPTVAVQGEGNAPAVDFDILDPTLPPTGYTLLETTVIVDPEGGEWVKLEYSDGIERVFLMHQEPVDSDLPGGASLGRVDAMELGPWNVITGQVQGYSLLILGKAPKDDLLLMLQSAL